jgi:hypothetical protein
MHAKGEWALSAVAMVYNEDKSRHVADACEASQDGDIKEPIAWSG